MLFKNPLGTRKDFYEVYRQFGHAPSYRFGSPDLANGSVYGMDKLAAVIL
jgi:hypothetical protein